MASEPSPQYRPLPKEEPRNIQLVHGPRHAHAAAEDKDDGRNHKQHPRRVE